MTTETITWALALSLIATGAASRYDPGVFETVERVRGMGPWSGSEVALLDCDRVGDTVLVCHEQACRWARVTDCAGVADGGRAWMIRGGYAAELDYKTAMHWDCVGEQIRVYDARWVLRREYQAL